MSESKTLPMLIRNASAVAELLADADGEITPEIESQLDSSNQELAAKADAYGMVMIQLEMQIEAAKTRLSEWGYFIRTRENALENMKNRLLIGMQTLEIAELAGSEVTFKIQLNNPSVVIENEALLPGEFITVEQPPPVKKIDKRQILEALKIGKPVPGARCERGSRLVKKVGTAKPMRTGV